MLNPVWTIEKKRDGKELSDHEIQSFIQGVADGKTADYQASAFLMSVYFQGMTLPETVALTRSMLGSGERYDLTHIPGTKIDKHSTGGVGDKVSLILAPLAAACGLKVPMMSGRGLGHSGGTLDKLESIRGFNVKLTKPEFDRVLAQVGCAMIGQSEKIAPVDKKLYSLRDVTGTVECIPLIVASILSKKLAEGSQGLVMDVKVGSGAFMKTREQARRLAKTLISVAKKMDLSCKAVLSDMNQPLGYAVGNWLEVVESVQVLQNAKPPEFSSTDLRELTVLLCAHMLQIGKVVRNLVEGKNLARKKLNDGSAWRVFLELVKEQGGDLEQVQNLEKGPRAEKVELWKAQKSGFINRMDTEAIGKLLVELGGGRKQASDLVDHSVGMLFHKKLGTRVSAGDVLVTVHASPSKMGITLAALEERFHETLEISSHRKAAPKLVLETL